MCNHAQQYEAAIEAWRVSPLRAFNVTGATSRRKLNQFATLYRFKDGSSLLIKPSRIEAWHEDWKGTKTDHHLCPVWVPSKK